jgi:hypothetical protein
MLAMAAWTWPPAGASPSPEEGGAAKEQRFVELVRESTERYRDRDRAVADGYRLIGRDFPGMGEHWVNVGLLFDGVYDPTRPEFLAYLTIHGVPKLLGVAYGLPLLAGEEPPEEPAGRAAWHAHTGTIDEETLLPHHHHSGQREDGPRLAMVHAWVFLPNPEGVFAADNWSIPFVRLGLEPPAAPAPAAGRALSLLTGGDAYVSEVVANALARRDASRSVRAAVSRARERLEGWRRRSMTSGPLEPGDLRALAALWDGLWSEVDAALPPAVRSRLQGSSVR